MRIGNLFQVRQIYVNTSRIQNKYNSNEEKLKIILEKVFLELDDTKRTICKHVAV